MRALTLLWVLTGAAQALPADTWLVAIGNNRGDADEQALLYAERDARELAEVLRRLGPVEPRRITLLLDEDAATVRRTLAEVNAAVREQARQGQPSTLVVFYSGHADARALHLSGSALPFDDLRTLVKGSAAAFRLLVVDACRSGGVSRVKGVQAAPAFDISIVPNAAEGMAIVTSSTAGEASQESDRLRASFFSHHLVNALRGAADRNADGRVTLGEAYAYTYAQTLRSSGRTMVLQHPTYAFDVKGRGEVVLANLQAADARSGRLRLGDPGIYLVSAEREGGPVVAEVAPPDANALIALPARRYFVQARQPREFREYTVELTAGQTTDLAGLPHRTVEYDRLVRQRGAPRTAVHGLRLLAGARGEIVDGEGVAPQLVLGYGLDLPWFSLGLRLRGSTVRSAGADGDAPRRHDELGLGLTLQRFVDLRDLSLAFGVLVEGAGHRQVFETSRDAPDRRSLSLAFGGLFSVERHLGSGLAVRLEGGPLTTVIEQRGDRGDAETATPFTWWAAAGVVWRR